MRRPNEPHPDNPFRKGDRVRLKPAHVPPARLGRPRNGPWTGTVATQPRTAHLVTINWDGTKSADVRQVSKIEKVKPARPRRAPGRRPG